MQNAVAGTVVAALLALCAGCSGSPTAAPPAPASASSANAASPVPAAPGPSPQARLVCEPEAQEDIALQLGVDAATVGPPQYANSTSTCRYAYPQGGFTLSVQDLPDAPATTRAYDALGAKMGRVQNIDLGPAKAFTTSNGSVVMQKDTKVLLVDVTDLPDPFGKPPVPRPQAALLITKAVLGCWTE